MGGLDPQIGDDGIVAPAPEPQPRFGASHAIVSFLLAAFGQLVMSVAVVMVMTFHAIASGKDFNDQAVVKETMSSALGMSLIVTLAVSALITLAAMKILAGHLLRDRTPSGLGLFVPSWKAMLLWTGAGLGVGALYMLLRYFIPTDWQGGPMARALAENPDLRMVVAVIAIFYAPVFEELLYRGLMLRGMLATWGAMTAGIVVTLLFFAMHLPETIGYWPAMLAILGISLVTLFARLRTGSLVPAMLAHLAYNVLALIALSARP